MKTFMLALLASGLFIAPALAKTSNANPIITVNHWAGTWDCVSGKDKYTEVFTPIFNGKAMRVIVTGRYAADGDAVYDASRKAWFYTFVNSDGTYSSMTGPVSGANISFKQVFPPGTTTENIHAISSSKYSSMFSMSVNNKTVTAGESCTRR